MITFNLKGAGSFLLKHGHVFTIRSARRPTGRQKLYVNHHVRGFANVTRVQVNVDKLDDEEKRSFYTKESGYETWEEWLKAARDVNLEADPSRQVEGMAIYRVELIDDPKLGKLNQ